ncbi:MAG: dTDP-4-dehydrorhamnose reductase [Blastocatellia bacterium AA13]|nr:MAG: dTDP-4-dehydrorhamnose reductase [Blastocatellia bacterium AA13]
MSDGKAPVLITGAGGLLGRCLVERLTGQGREVIGLAHAELDITRHDDVARRIQSINPAAVINAAATTDVDRCETDPKWAYAVNEAGPRYLASECEAIGAQFVHIGTDYVFSGDKEGFYTQDDAPNPSGVYAQSKLAGERAALEETDRCYIVRSSWIFGLGGKNFGSKVLNYARAGARLKGVIDQTSIPTYAPDLAARIITIIEREVYGLYHVTNSGTATWFEFARMALDLAGMSEVEIEPVKRADLNQAAPRPRNSAMRCLMSERLGLAPLRRWSEALEEFVREEALVESNPNPAQAP